MYKLSEFKKEIYKPGEVAKILNITYQSIKNYDKFGKLEIKRSNTNRRIILKDDLLEYLRSKGLLDETQENNDKEKYNVIYARVSSQYQKSKGDLDRQVMFLLDNLPDLKNLMILKEVGSGLNAKRSKLQQLLKLILENKVNKIYITYKDRLTRFGFDYLKTVCDFYNVEIIILHDEKDKSIQQELVEDMMNLLASFSGKLYGMRSSKNKNKSLFTEKLEEAIAKEK